LPLRDTKFNNLKSDIKLIECCSCGVVPIMSEVVYGETKEAAEIGILVRPGQSWGQALINLVNEPERLTALKEVAFNYVTAQRMHSHTIHGRLDWYRGLIANRAQLEAERQERLKAIGLSGFLVD
jgi:hypothetical protein